MLRFNGAAGAGARGRRGVAGGGGGAARRRGGGADAVAGLGLGAAPATSAASVTFAWLIRATWSIRCAPAPAINRRTRINHHNRRTPPPAVTPVACCDGRDEQRQAEAVLTSRPGQPRYSLELVRRCHRPGGLWCWRAQTRRVR